MDLKALLQQLLDWMLLLWPVRIVDQWEQAIRVRLGTAQRGVLKHDNGWHGRGWHWLIPYVDEVIPRECNYEVTETDMQSVRLGDGTNVSFSFAVRWRVADLYLLHTTVQEAEDSVLDAVRGAAGSVACDLEDLEDAHARLTRLTMRAAKRAMYGWGVELHSLRRVNFTTAQVIRLLQDSE